jgi:hypothetical protein
MKIYVASSWRNPHQPNVVKALQALKHSVYDFRNPKEGDSGFHWSEIDPNWKTWTPEEYRNNLDHPLAQEGFKSDFDALKWAEVVLGVQPFGRSASLELGWAAGAGKQTILLLDHGEPELMVKMADHICCSLTEVVEVLKTCQIKHSGTPEFDERATLLERIDKTIQQSEHLEKSDRFSPRRIRALQRLGANLTKYQENLLAQQVTLQQMRIMLDQELELIGGK